VKLRFKDDKGLFVGEKAIDEEDFVDAVDVSLGAVTFSLPEGKWQIEIISGENKIVSTGKIFVKRNSGIRKIFKQTTQNRSNRRK
ncbi:MAG: hypothetical protein M3R10_07345, partial [Verrucomicrobiota bacterium]|nr:hypothetical protein [Verrucomicrobiota bacterium]